MVGLGTARVDLELFYRERDSGSIPANHHKRTVVLAVCNVCGNLKLS